MDAMTFHLEKVVKTKEEYEDFEGPLDLILYLLSKNKIEIKDIRISDILDQYLAHLEKIERQDLEAASEFVSMAAHLVYLKTRMLLSIDDKEVQEEMDQLIKSLEERSRMVEYRNMQLGAEYLSVRAEVGRSIFVKPPEEIEVDKSYPYIHNPGELPDAIAQIRIRTSRRMPPPISSFRGIVGKEPYPVPVKVSELLQRFLFVPVSKLRALIAQCRSRSEIVATFLAILELCKENRASISMQGEEYEIASVADGGPGTSE